MLNAHCALPLVAALLDAQNQVGHLSARDNFAGLHAHQEAWQALHAVSLLPLACAGGQFVGARLWRMMFATGWRRDLVFPLPKGTWIGQGVRRVDLDALGAEVCFRGAFSK